MAGLLPAICLLLGLTVGGLVAWAVLKKEIQNAAERGRRESDAKSAAIEERLVACKSLQETRDSEILTLKASLESSREMIRREVEIRSKAEERASERKRLEEEAGVKDAQIKALHDENKTLSARCASLEQALANEREQADQKIAVLTTAREAFTNTFKALASDTLGQNNKSFLELAQTEFAKLRETSQGDLDQRRAAIGHLVKPVRKALKGIHTKIQALEQAREGAYQGLLAEVKVLGESQLQLRSETSKLVQALRNPSSRGRWGEIQLKRVVELAGMQEYCDFVTQPSLDTDDGRLRPDVIVMLPGNRRIVLDSKVPLSAYLEAVESQDDALCQQKLKDHAGQVRSHVLALSRKDYSAHIQPAPDFVILFLPGEIFFSAALQHDPELIEVGAAGNVIIATPSSLIALLRTVAFGWRQEALAKNAQAISDLGRELYERVRVMGTHLEKLRKSLTGSVEAYNMTVRSLESRVLPSTRRFKELKAGTENKTIELLEQIELVPASLSAPELLANSDLPEDEESLLATRPRLLE